MLQQGTKTCQGARLYRLLHPPISPETRAERLAPVNFPGGICLDFEARSWPPSASLPRPIRRALQEAGLL